MILEPIVPLLSPAISFAGFLLVIWQLRRGTKQRQLDSLVKIYDINRQLIILGFSQADLFGIMESVENVDPVRERRFLQLWLNQFALVHSYMYESVFKREIKDNLTRDISDFMMMENMQRHWRQHGAFYPASFQKFVNDILEKK